MATAVTDEVKHHDIAELHTSAADEPWLTRVAWLWTLLCLGLVVTFLRFAVDHP